MARHGQSGSQFRAADKIALMVETNRFHTSLSRISEPYDAGDRGAAFCTHVASNYSNVWRMGTSRGICVGANRGIPQLEVQRRATLQPDDDQTYQPTCSTAIARRRIEIWFVGAREYI